MNSKIMLLSSVILAAIGQVLFKKGVSAAKLGDISFGFSGILKMVFSPIVLLGLFFYGLSTLIWLAALSKTQLNYAYPFTALTFILVMVASQFIFSEVMPLNRLIGVVLICAGFLVAAIK